MKNHTITPASIIALIAISISGLELSWYVYPIIGAIALYFSMFVGKGLIGIYQHPSKKEYYKELRRHQRGKRSKTSFPSVYWITDKFAKMEYRLKQFFNYK